MIRASQWLAGLVFSFNVLLALVASTSFADENATTNSAPRDPVEISREETALVRLTSKKTDEVQRVKAIVGLCKLFVEIGEHPQVADNATLQRVSVEVQARLRGIEQRLISELRRRKIEEPQSMIDEQRNRRLGRNRNFANQQSGNSAGEASGQSLSESASGSSNAMNFAGLSGPGDFNEMGWWLVGLIRHTVEPDYWDTSGGPGTVVYYGPSRALVIRGSWRIHEQVADLLSALR